MQEIIGRTVLQKRWSKDLMDLKDIIDPLELKKYMEASHIKSRDIRAIYSLEEICLNVHRDRHAGSVTSWKTIYLQGISGKLDYKYVKGLGYFIPVRNMFKDLAEFMNGEWYR